MSLLDRSSRVSMARLIPEEATTMSDTPEPTKVDVENALHWVRLGDPDAVASSASVLAHEVEHLRQVIREYVAQVESGERFDALVDAVPGLESDDGAYPTGQLDRLREQNAALRESYDEAEQIAKRAESAANTALGMCMARRPHDEIRDYLMSVGE